MGKDSYFCQMKKKLFHFIDTTDSTNNFLKKLAEDKLLSNNNLPEFYTVYTAEQTHGRGQGTNTWESSRGANILASIYFIPPIPPVSQFIFNQYFSLAIRKLLLRYLPKVQIKWPNDIYVGSDKIGGILIEHFLEGDCISRTIAGIGINVNQVQFSSSIPNPISLKMITEKTYDTKSLLEQFIEILKQDYHLLNIQNHLILKNEYLNALYQYQEKHLYLINGIETMKIITGIDSYGRLLLMDEKGNTSSFGLKEVKFL